MLEPGRWVKCIGSRRRRAAGGLDSRTPAPRISGGTGRDGRENRGAPKVGWGLTQSTAAETEEHPCERLTLLAE